MTSYCKVPSIKAQAAKLRVFRVLNEAQHKRKVKETQDKRAVSLFTWLVVIAAFIFAALAATGCSASRKADLCAKWEAENPEYFLRSPDTILTIKKADPDTVLSFIDLEHPPTKPATFKNGSVTLNLKPVGSGLALEAFNEPCSDTIIEVRTKYRDKVNAAPDQLKSKFWRGFAWGSASLLVLFLVLKIILK